jgi:hypothetical protein
MPQPLEYEQAGYNGPDGLQLGRTSTDLVSLYGATPAVRAVTVSTNDVSTVSTTSASSGKIIWGFASQVEIDNVVTAVSTMQRALKQLGILP